MIDRFNIRVYGLLINGNNEILISKERIGQFAFTKFPGGGLELGEGIADCLIREFKEEVDIDIEITAHFYTTDFFQQSAFKHTDQLISIYYKVRSLSDIALINKEEVTLWNDGREEQQQLLWVSLSQLTPDGFTFPIDKHVVQMLTNN
jgi:8-oxo-dGTP diphosphatase